MAQHVLGDLMATAFIGHLTSQIVFCYSEASQETLMVFLSKKKRTNSLLWSPSSIENPTQKQFSPLKIISSTIISSIFIHQKETGFFFFSFHQSLMIQSRGFFRVQLEKKPIQKAGGNCHPINPYFFCGIFWNGIQKTNCWLLTPANSWIFLPVWSRDLSILQTARVVQNFFKSRDFCCSPRKGCLFCRCLDSELCWNYQILFLKFLQTNKRLNEWSDHLGIFFGGDFFTMNIQDIRYWMLQIPPGELSYPTWGKGKSSSKVPW